MKHLLLTTIAAVLFVGTASANPIHDAAKEGNSAGVLVELDKGVDVNVKSLKGLTPLHYAVFFGHYDSVKLLIDNGADVNEIFFSKHHLDSEGGLDRGDFINNIGNESNTIKTTALHIAIKHKYREIVKLLIAKNANLDLLLFKGTNINTKDKWGYSYLQRGIFWGYKPIIKFFIFKGANLNDRNSEGRTALHEAALKADADVLIILANAGSDIDLKDKVGMTAFDLLTCITNSSTESNTVSLEKVLKLIDPQKTTKDDNLLVDHFYTAIAYGNVNKVNNFLDSGKSVNQTFGSYYNSDSKSYIYVISPLHLATLCGHYEIVKLLISKGAELNARTIDREVLSLLEPYTGRGYSPIKYLGQTALYIAAKYGKYRIAKLLISKGAAINKEYCDGFTFVSTPLNAAINNDNLEVEKLIRNNGGALFSELSMEGSIINGDVDYLKKHLKIDKNINNYTAYANDVMTLLQLSALQGHIEILKILIENKAHINKTSKEGLSTMHYALGGIDPLVANDNLEILKLLLINGADLNITTPERYDFSGEFTPATGIQEAKSVRQLWGGMTPLHYAIWKKVNINIIKLLKVNSADLNIKCELGLSPLDSAIKSNYSEAVEILSNDVPITELPKITLIGSMHNPGFSFVAEKGKPYIVEASHDFKIWKGFLKVIGDGTLKTIRYTDLDVPLMKSKYEFFRLKSIH